MVTEDCNLRCNYCFEEHFKTKMSIETANTIVEYLYQNALSTGHNSVSFNIFGGEPLMNLDVVEAIFKNIEKHKNNKIFKDIFPYITITTNGTIFNDRYEYLLKKFAMSLPVSIQISFDGIKEAQDAERCFENGSGSFDIITSNFKKYKKIFGNSINNFVNVHGCITKKNLPFLYDSFVFFKNELEIDNIWFYPIPEEKWDLDDVIIHKDQYNKIASFLIEEAKNTNDISKFKLFRPFSSFCRMGSTSVSACAAGSYMIGVDSSGDVYPCHQFKYYGKEFLAGNIKDLSSLDYSSYKIFRETKLKHMSCINTCDVGSCDTCVANNYYQNGSIFSKVRSPFFCSFMSNEKKSFDSMFKIFKEVIFLDFLKDRKNIVVKDGDLLFKYKREIEENGSIVVDFENSLGEVKRFSFFLENEQELKKQDCACEEKKEDYTYEIISSVIEISNEVEKIKKKVFGDD